MLNVYCVFRNRLIDLFMLLSSQPKTGSALASSLTALYKCFVFLTAVVLNQRDVYVKEFSRRISYIFIYFFDAIIIFFDNIVGKLCFYN